MVRRILTLIVFVPLTVGGGLRGQASEGTWGFAVSGDSRNCGDVVMPAIAESALKQRAEFYWHLGDFRAIFNFDQDYLQLHSAANISQYENNAWSDFIEHQIKPFGEMPVYLSIGNHETISPKTRPEYLVQFADWLVTPTLELQRLSDDPSDHKLRAYYHWIVRNVDFVNLDNATEDQFDSDQINWFAAVLRRAAKDDKIRSVVVGMHAALPDSLSAGHSMNESGQGTASGRVVYDELLSFRRTSGKAVYVLASHSHFFLSDVYATACRVKADVLPGWIVGTAGAVRYRLPRGVKPSDRAIQDTYGYLLGTVSPDGTIRFDFESISEAEALSRTKEFTPAFVHTCFEDNKSTYVPDGPVCEKTADGR